MIKSRVSFRIIRSAAGFGIGLVVAVGLVVAFSQIRPGQAAPTYKYIALGDSIASGHGIHPYGSGPGDVACKRAAGTTPGVDYAYPDYVRDYLEQQRPVLLAPSDFHNLACSGAPVKDLNKQVSAALKLINGKGKADDSPAIVSITIGADDFKFDKPDTYAQAFNPQTYNDFVNFRNDQANTIRKTLPKEIDRLWASGVDRQVVVTGYYNPFNPESVIFQAADSGIFSAQCDEQYGVRPPCLQVVDDTVQVLNDAINDALANVNGNVRFVSGDTLVGAFTGHESPQPYCGLGGPVFADSYIQALDATFPMDVKHPPTDGDDCFHPNDVGHHIISNFVTSALPYGS